MKLSLTPNISPLQTSSSFNFSFSTLQSRKRLLNFYPYHFHINKINRFNNYHKSFLHEKFMNLCDLETSLNKSKKFINSLSNEKDNNKKINPKKLDLEIRSLYSKKNYKNTYSFILTSNKFSKLKKIINIKQKDYIKKREKSIEKNQKLKNSFEYSKTRLINIQNKIIPEYKNYLKFLYKKINQELANYYKLQNKKNELLIDIYRLKLKIGKLNIKKEEYIDKKKFLIRVKENIKVLPEIFINFSYDFDSNLKNKFETPKKQKRNSINNFSNSKKQSLSLNRERKRKTQRYSSFFIIHNTEFNKYYKYINNSNTIFDSSEEFINYIKEIEIRNVKLVDKYNKLRLDIFNLQTELKNIEIDYNNYKKLVKDDLEKKELLYFENKSKNEYLIKRIEQINNKNSQIKIKNIDLDSLNYSNLFKLRFEKLKNEKKFQKENSYIFYYLYLIFKNLIFFQTSFFENLDEPKKNEYLEILSNPDNYLERIKFSLAKQILLYIENIFGIIQININKLTNNLKERNFKKIHNYIITQRKINNAKEQKLLLNQKKLNNLNQILEKKQRFKYKIRRKYINFFDLSNKKSNNKTTYKTNKSSFNSQINEIFSE